MSGMKRTLALIPVIVLAGCGAVSRSVPRLAQETPPGALPVQTNGKGSGGEKKAPHYAEARPSAEDRDELTVVCTEGGGVELDFRKSYLATEAQLYTALYEGLFSYHPLTMEPVMAAAENWSLSDDKKQWTFTIRESAKYWNGDPLRAADFRTAWLSLMEPGRNSPYSSLFDIIDGAREYRLGAAGPETVGISADDRTLVVRLASPAAFFPSMLCHHSFSPLHPSMTDNDDWSQAAPLSNGPFYIQENGAGRILLVKNENYWDKAHVSLNRVILRYAKDADEATALWNSGEARWISGDVNLDGLTDLSGIQVNPMFATHYYYIRSGEKPWDDYRVRRALILALPWDEVRSGYALPARTLIFPIPGYPKIEGPAETDLEEAARLLEEAGYPKGAGLPQLVIRLTPSPDAGRIGALMAKAWHGMGLSVKVEVVPYSQYFESLKRKDYIVASSTWIGDFADPYTFLQMWRRDSNLNDAGYNDEDYETLMEKSMTEEGAERWATLAEAEKLLLDRGTVLPVFYTPAINIISTSEIGGWYKNVLDIHPFKYLQFKAYRPLPGVTLAPGAGIGK